MKTYVALLRAINVGGTGKIDMSTLKALCEEIGFEEVRTYIQSGNLVFRTNMIIAQAETTLSARLRDHFGKPVGVVIREAADLRDVLKRNPFGAAEAKAVSILFLNESPPGDVVDTAKGRKDEEIVVSGREIFIHYPSGMGKSRLRLAAFDHGTARNPNTVTRLAEMAADAD